MPDRRRSERPDSSDRRTFPRPPLWLNLLLLLLGIAGIAFARYHRDRVETRFADVIAQQQRSPEDIRKVKDDLAELDLTREQLQRELQSRVKFADSLKSEEFYLSIDTKAKKLRFYYGDTILREADVVVGEEKSITVGEKTWTFVPLKGAFSIEAKLVGHDWTIPEWVYQMNEMPIPNSRPAIPDGLGRYVLFIGNGYAIHSPPSNASPLKGAKPGSYMVADEFLRAVWQQIHKEKTKVYIF
ncbi:MAG TPA: hypothetical protein VF701_08960 [Thermoanaerobaculia bacterium]